MSAFIDLPGEATAVPLHLSVDPWWDVVTALAYGRTDDGLPPDQVVALADEPRIAFVLDAPGRGPVIGVRVRHLDEVDVAGLEAPELWDGPRFEVPTLGLAGAAAGEILLAVQGRFAEGEPTADAMHFHLAIGTPDEEAEEGEQAADVDTIVGRWRLALEAGDMKALFGLGYTLVEAGRPREGYDALRRYTELTPFNAWAWCWLGRACSELGETAEARRALERALECERHGSFETDAADLLQQLGA